MHKTIPRSKTTDDLHKTNRGISISEDTKNKDLLQHEMYFFDAKQVEPGELDINDFINKPTFLSMQIIYG